MQKKFSILFVVDEIQELERLVCQGNDNNNPIEDALKTLTAEFELMQQALRECTLADQDAVKMLTTKIKAARVTFESVREHRLPTINPVVNQHPNANTTRQTRFTSTKKKRKLAVKRALLI